MSSVVIGAGIVIFTFSMMVSLLFGFMLFFSEPVRFKLIGGSILLIALAMIAGVISYTMTLY